MRVAVLDLGTNTFNLLIRDTASEQLLYNDKLNVKLGEGGLDDNLIAPEAFQRGLDALRTHKTTINQYGVDETYAFATSAMRSASNGDDFVAMARESLQIEINVIDGQQEAELIYMGVRQALPLGDSITLIMDIGGGSTEFILADQNQVHWKESFDIGSSRLLEKFGPSDPITDDEVEEIKQHIDQTISSLYEACLEHPPTSLIGSSGSFDTLAAMIQAQHQDLAMGEGFTSYTFDIEHYNDMARRMISFSYKERLNTPGMIAMRAALMPMACIQIDLILEKLKMNEFKLSTFALKEGVFASLKKPNSWLRSL